MINDATIFILPLIISKITRAYILSKTFDGVYCYSSDKPHLIDCLFVRFKNVPGDRSIYRMVRDSKDEKNFHSYYYTKDGYVDFVFKIPKGMIKYDVDLIKLGFLKAIYSKSKDKILTFWGANINNKLFKILYRRLEYKPIFGIPHIQAKRNPDGLSDHQGFLLSPRKKFTAILF